MSIFEQKTIEQLSHEMGSSMNRYNYEQISAQKSVVGSAFSGGTIIYKFNNGATDWVLFNRSYFRMRANFFKTGTTALKINDGIAPAMNLMAGLFNSVKVMIENKEVCSLRDFVPQCDTISTRLDRSKIWLDGIGSSINFWDASFNKRLNKISSDGVVYGEGGESIAYTSAQFGFGPTAKIAYDNTSGVATFSIDATIPFPLILTKNDIIVTATGARLTVVAVLTSPNVNAATVTCLAGAWTGNIAAETGFSFERPSPASPSRRLYGVEVIWRPNFGVFKLPNALPLGEYQIHLNPKSSSVIQTCAAESLVAKTYSDDFTFAVVDMYFYAAKIKGPAVKDGIMKYILDDIDCTTKSVTAGSATLTYQVSPGTMALAVAPQHQSAGSSTLYNECKFRLASNQERNITSLQIQYAGQSKSDPQSDTDISKGDRLVERYYNTHIYGGGINSCGGPESYVDWLTRGPFYFYAWPKDSTDKSTDVKVRLTTGTFADANMLLFSFTKRFLQMRIKDSAVVEVSSIPI
jgi:hypothetical protein